MYTLNSLSGWKGLAKFIPRDCLNFTLKYILFSLRSTHYFMNNQIILGCPWIKIFTGTHCIKDWCFEIVNYSGVHIFYHLPATSVKVLVKNKLKETVCVVSAIPIINGSLASLFWLYVHPLFEKCLFSTLVSPEADLRISAKDLSRIIDPWIKVLNRDVPLYIKIT